MQRSILRTLGIVLWGVAVFEFLDDRIGFAVVLAVLGTIALALSRSLGVTTEQASFAPIDLDDAQLTVVLELLDAGRKIEAIKHVRDASGAGLKESKAYVDAIQEG